MKFIVPVAITETTYTEGAGGAATSVSVTDNSIQPFVTMAAYPPNQQVLDAGVVYKRLNSNIRGGRPFAPGSDPAVWAATSRPTTLPTWVSGGTYALGDRRVISSTHRVYECVFAHTGSAVSPNADSVNWLDIGPTNAWAMFDNSSSTRTTGVSPLTFTLRPGVASAIAFNDVVGASSITVSMMDGVTEVFSSTVDMSDFAFLTDWWDYFFGGIAPRTDAVITDMPPYSSASINVIVTGTGPVGVGNVSVGNVTDVAPAKYGAEVSVIDYSVKETDAFGQTNLVERKYSKRADVSMLIENNRLDYIAQRLAAVRATPCVWFDESGFQSLILYGHIRDWRINISYPTKSDCTLSLESLA